MLKLWILNLILFPIVLFAHVEGESPVEFFFPKGRKIKSAPAQLSFKLINKIDEEIVPLEKLEKVHQYKLHAFLFDTSLEIFQHLHPTCDEKGNWTLPITLESKGNYYLWVQGTLKETQTTFAANALITVEEGKPGVKIKPFQESKRGSVLQREAKIRIDASLIAGWANPTTIELQRLDKKAFQLQPLLGEPAHIILISQDGRIFEHAHAMDILHPGGHAHTLSKKTREEAEKLWKEKGIQLLQAPLEVSKEGNYRVWVQFKESDEEMAIPLDLTFGGEIAWKKQDPTLPTSSFQYTPGKEISWKQYKEREADSWNEFKKFREREWPQAVQSFQKFQEGLEKEILPALFYALKDPLAVVSYQTFTDPKERHQGKYETSQDDAAGLRVVWLSKVQSRLISIIFFFELDLASLKNGMIRFQPISQQDAMRVRVEVKELDHMGRGFIGLSYEIHMDTGKVKTLFPGIYFTIEEKQPGKGITTHAHADMCLMCHHDRSYFTPQQLTQSFKNEFGELPGYIDFLSWARKINTDEKVITELKKQLSTPRKTFTLPGLLEAIAKRGNLPL